MRIDTLKDTVKYMCSNDYKERFIAEYKQLYIRYEALKKMVYNWDHGLLNFTPTCERKVYDAQLKAMEDYLLVLQNRAEVEEIDLG